MFATCRVSWTMEILTLILPSGDLGQSQQSGSHDDSRSPPENWGHPWFPGSRTQECGPCSWQGTGWQSKGLYLRNGAHYMSLVILLPGMHSDSCWAWPVTGQGALLKVRTEDKLQQRTWGEKGVIGEKVEWWKGTARIKKQRLWEEHLGLTYLFIQAFS